MLTKLLILLVPISCQQSLSDKNTLFGYLEFAIYAKDKGIQPISALALDIKFDKNIDQILLICQNEIGFKNLLQLTSLYHTPEEQANITIEDVEKYSQGLICLITNRKKLKYIKILEEA